MAPLKVGILLVGSGVQLLDLSAVDILAMSCVEYLKVAQIPEAVHSKGQSMEFLYITEKGEGPYPVTADLKVQATVRRHSIIRFVSSNQRLPSASSMGSTAPGSWTTC